MQNRNWSIKISSKHCNDSKAISCKNNLLLKLVFFVFIVRYNLVRLKERLIQYWYINTYNKMQEVYQSNFCREKERTFVQNCAKMIMQSQREFLCGENRQRGLTLFNLESFLTLLTSLHGVHQSIKESRNCNAPSLLNYLQSN